MTQPSAHRGWQPSESGGLEPVTLCPRRQPCPLPLSSIATSPQGLPPASPGEETNLSNVKERTNPQPTLIDRPSALWCSFSLLSGIARI